MTTAPSTPVESSPELDPNPAPEATTKKKRSSVVANLRQLNPVLDRELRQRSRNGRSVVVMVTFLLLASGVAYLSFLGETASTDGDAFAILSRGVGRTMFEWVLILELILLLAVIPGLSAGAITGERDRQTLIPLQVTLVSPLGIVMGKILSSASFVLLLIVASTPVMAAAYLLGGITILQVLQSMAALLVIGFLLAAVGVACSALARGTAAATLFAYGFMLLLTVGTGAIFVAMMIIYAVFINDNFNVPPRVMSIPFAFNPFVALASAGGVVSSNFSSPWPLSGIRMAFFEWWFPGQGWNEEAIGADGNQIASGWFGLKMWISCFAALGSLTSFMVWRSVLRLRTPAAVVRQ